MATQFPKPETDPEALPRVVALEATRLGGSVVYEDGSPAPFNIQVVIDENGEIDDLVPVEAE